MATDAVNWAETGRAGPAVVWHAYPLGMLGADQSGRDRNSPATLRDVALWLPHVTSVGADTMLLGPVFASLSHGYDTVTHAEVDDRLGTTADLEALIDAAAARGVGLVLDGVFAYTSRQFWRLSDPAEQVDPWFLRDTDGDLVPWRVDSLITPDYTSTGYRSYVADVMSGWLDRGVRGWRLDSAWSVPPGFWRSVLARVRSTHPNAWFLGQVFDDDLPPVVNNSTYSSATEYALMHGVRGWLAGGSTAEMDATLRVHQHNCTRTPVHTFVGNHDFARLSDVVAPGLAGAAFCLLMTLPGIPAVYYGDELAVTSTWAEGGPDALLRGPLAPDAPDAARGYARELVETVRALGTFRHANPWLTHATLDDILARSGVVAYAVHGDGRTIRVFVNTTAEPVNFEYDGRWEPVLGTAAMGADHGVEVAPRSFAVVRPA